jgi:NAD(P)-dependent dehydrogenase (short-subunit alcohol dehydrogenase family)
VINIASLGAFQPYPGIGHYEAAEAGVIALTRAAALELAPHRIRVNAIAPGVIETPLTAANLANPETRSARLSRIPLGRFGRPEDVANLAVVLASDESAFMTGTVVIADGGQLLV